MAKLGDFINSLALKAGVASDSPELKSFLADPACQIEIDSKISDSINSSLMTIDAAANNQAVIDRATALVYNKVDHNLSLSVLDSFDDEEKVAFNSTKQTSDKLRFVGAKITKLIAAQKAAPKGADKAEFQKEIDALQESLKLEKAARAEFETATKTKYENDSIDTNLKYSLYGKNWRLPTETEADKLFATDTAANRVKMELAAKGYKLISENGQLQLRTIDDRKVFDPANNTEVGFQQFVTGAIAQLITPIKTDPDKSKLPGAGGQGRETNGHKIRGQEDSKAAFASLEENFVTQQ